MEQDENRQILQSVDKVVLILSGKGGVGKSTVAVQLALSLAAAGKKVGLLDIDLCGPSVPRMLGLRGCNVLQSEEGWQPVEVPDCCSNGSGKLVVMSIGFLAKNEDDAVIWRGPKKHAMINQFITDVSWGQLDYLVIDTPPGTSDEHISIVETLRSYRNPDGAILVTTPQAVAVADVRREVTFCRKANIPILGIVENMCGYSCPHCAECTHIFSKGGGRALAQYSGVPFLGEIPIEPQLTRCLETGINFVGQYKESIAAQRFKGIASQVLDPKSSAPS